MDDLTGQQKLALEIIGKRAAIVARGEQLSMDLLHAIADAIESGQVPNPVVETFHNMVDFKHERGTLPEDLNRFVRGTRP